MATLKGPGRRQGSIRIRSSKTGPVKEQSWGYIVHADSITESREAVLDATGLYVGSIDDDLGACKSLDGQFREENPLIWDVTAEFSTEVSDASGSDSSQPDDDPEAWVPTYKTQSETIQEVSITDLNGDAIANSAGVPFEVGLIRNRSIPVWEFWQFEPASVSDETVLARNEVINSIPFRGRAPETLMCVVVDSEIGYFYDELRRLTNYKLKYNFKKWTDKRLDVGSTYLKNGKLDAYEDEGGNPILGALNGSGGKQAAGTPPAIREFDQYEKVAFAAFLRLTPAT